MRCCWTYARRANGPNRTPRTRSISARACWSVTSRFPDKETEIIMYCGGGYRSALTCDAAQKMGYTNVSSLENGYRGLIAADWAMEAG